jgi:antitoxin component YwqK of YwqJK toxin-antitoxin module
MFEETYSNGTPRCKFHLKNGKKDGPYIEYYETAGFVYERVESKDGYPEEVVQKIKGIQIRVSGNYKADLEDGIFTYYTVDGKVEKKVKYKDGKEVAEP